MAVARAREGDHRRRPAFYVRWRVIWRPIRNECARSLDIKVHSRCIQSEYRMNPKCIRNAYQLGIYRICRRWARKTRKTAVKHAKTHRARVVRARTRVYAPNTRVQQCPTVHSRTSAPKTRSVKLGPCPTSLPPLFEGR